MVDEYERSEDEYEDLPVETGSVAIKINYFLILFFLCTDDEFQEVTENLIVTSLLINIIQEF
jgi:hypothetical protein